MYVALSVIIPNIDTPSDPETCTHSYERKTPAHRVLGND